MTIRSNIIVPKAGNISVNREFHLGTAAYDLDSLYSPDSAIDQSIVLDLASPKYEPNKTYWFDKSKYNNHGTITGAVWQRLPSGIWVLSFDGTDDKVDLGSDFIKTSACTIMGWIYPTGWGGNNAGRVIDNGNCLIYLNNSGNIQLSSNALANNAAAGNGAITLNNWKHICVTRIADGTANWYINGVLSGNANQASGTPAGGTTNAVVGNRLAGDRGFAGPISPIRVVTSVFNQPIINQYFNRERHLYGV